MKGLKIQRIKRGVTQEELAAATALTVRQIRSYEQGQRNPKPQTLECIAKYFGCTIDELL